MSNFNVEDILADLEAEAEKTAEDTFLSSLTEETEDVSEEKVAEATEEKAKESTEEKTAEADEAEEETTEEKTAEEAVEETNEAEEKVAEATDDEAEEEATEEKTAAEQVDEATEKVAETQSIPSNKELVKMAQEFGKIAAHSLFTELAALGIAMPTNGEMAVPPISQVSRPQDSPVTVARDAKEQEEAGHAPYDKDHAHKPDGAGGYMKEKKASVVSGDLVKRIYNNIYSQEEN